MIWLIYLFVRASYTWILSEEVIEGLRNVFVGRFFVVDVHEISYSQKQMIFFFLPLLYWYLDLLRFFTLAKLLSGHCYSQKKINPPRVVSVWLGFYCFNTKRPWGLHPGQITFCKHVCKLRPCNVLFFGYTGKKKMFMHFGVLKPLCELSLHETTCRCKISSLLGVESYKLQL